MNQYLLLIMIMVGMGIFGGIINFFTLYKGGKKWLYFLFQNIFVGLGAAALVPLLLKTTVSNLLTDFGTAAFGRPDYFILAGFCLVAALLARVFVRSDSMVRRGERQPSSDLEHSIAELDRTVRQRLSELRSPANSPVRDRPASGRSHEAPAAETPDLSKDAKHFLATLKQPDYVFKSIEEIKDEIDISRSYLELILERLEAADLVTTIKRDGDVLWGLTYKGYSYNSR